MPQKGGHCATHDVHLTRKATGAKGGGSGAGRNAAT